MYVYIIIRWSIMFLVRCFSTATAIAEDSMGYESTWRKRPRPSSADGCCLAWRAGLFELISEESVEFAPWIDIWLYLCKLQVGKQPGKFWASQFGFEIVNHFPLGFWVTLAARICQRWKKTRPNQWDFVNSFPAKKGKQEQTKSRFPLGA